VDFEIAVFHETIPFFTVEIASHTALTVGARKERSQ
jgi:hypothetical protein